METIVIEPAGEKYHGAVLDFIYQDFFRYERLNVAIGGETSNRDLSESLFQSWLDEGNSFVAVDQQSDTVVGIAVNFTVRKTDSDQQDDDTPPSHRVRIFTSFIHDLEKDHDVFSEFNVEEGLELCFLGVAQEFSGKGLGTKLTLEVIKLAKHLKMGFVQSIPTAPATVHLFEKLGFQTKSEIKPEGYLLDGIPAFPHALPTDLARYVVMKL